MACIAQVFKRTRTGPSSSALHSHPARQVSSLLAVTYSIPWPPFYEKVIDAFAAVNIDISLLRKPINDFFGLLGGTFANASCNFNDMNAETMFSPCCVDDALAHVLDTAVWKS